MKTTHTQRMTLEEYEQTPVTYDYEELHFGWFVREEADTVGHQGELMWLSMLLLVHLRKRKLGFVFPHPTGVVLDEAKALKVQPDLTVLLKDRYHLIRGRLPGKPRKIFGPPNLVIECASPSTRRRDRQQKLEWYRTYGVQECWLVESDRREMEVFYLGTEPEAPGRTFRGSDILVSRVLPAFRRPTNRLFHDPLAELEEDERSSYDKGPS